MVNSFEKEIRDETIRRYEFEFKRKTEIHNRASLSFLIITFLFGMFFALLRTSSISNSLIFNIIYFVLLGLSVVFIVISFTYLMRVILPVFYKYHPSPQEFSNWRRELIKASPDKKIEEIDEKANNEAYERFYEEIEFNFKINNQRANLSYWAHIYSFIAIYFLIACVILNFIYK